MGVKIDDRTLHSLLFTDNQITFAKDYEEMEYMVQKLKEYENWGLKIIFNKTE
jgi:hypothetical protein